MGLLIIAGFVGGCLDVVGFAYGNYIWCVIGFFLGCYLAGTVWRFGSNLHHKDRQTIQILSLIYVIFNVSFLVYVLVANITENIYDRWSFLNSSNGKESFILKIIFSVLLASLTILGAMRLK